MKVSKGTTASLAQVKSMTLPDKSMPLALLSNGSDTTVSASVGAAAGATVAKTWEATPVLSTAIKPEEMCAAGAAAPDEADRLEAIAGNAGLDAADNILIPGVCKQGERRTPKGP